MSESLSKKDTQAAAPVGEEKFQAKEQSGLKNKLALWIGSIALAIVLVGAVSYAIALYYFDWNSGVSRSIIERVGIPAGLVNGKMISYEDYLQQKESLEHYNAKQAEFGLPTLESVETDGIEKTAMDRLIRSKILKQWADDYSLEVKPADVDQAFEDFMTMQSVSVEEVAQSLQDYYLWTIDDFKNDYIYEMLLREKLAAAVIKDSKLDVAQRLEAEQVLTRIQAAQTAVAENSEAQPETFEDIAREVSDDTSTASFGGDLGVFTLDEMVPEFSNAVAGLKEGEVSGVVRTIYGFHIIKLVDIIESEDGDATKNQYSAKHILIQGTPFEELLDAQVSEANVYHFVRY